MGNSSIQTTINGKVVKENMNWRDTTVSLAYGNDSTQPQVKADRLEFVLDGAAAIIKHKEDGKIFEKLTCQQTYTQGNGEFVVLDGFLHLAEEYEEINPTFGAGVERSNSVLAAFKQDEDIMNFLDKINGVSYGSLLEEGLISSQDYVTIKTAIIKRTNALQVAIAVLMIFSMGKQMVETVKAIGEAIVDIQKDISDAAAIAVSGATGAAGASAKLVSSAIIRAAILILELAYATALFVLIFKMVKSLTDLLLPPVIDNKGIKFRTLLEKSCEKFGFEFDSNIEELDTYHYLPSKPHASVDENKLFIDPEKIIPKHVANEIGIPNTSGDYGYLMNEFWDLMKRLFNTRINLSDNTIHLYNVNDVYWDKPSGFVPHESINFKTKRYNTDDLKQTRMLSFATDVQNDWSVDNFKGTSYEIKTQSTNSDIAKGVIKGIDDIDIPLQLPSVKKELTNIEKLVVEFAKAADFAASLLAINSTMAQDIKQNKINIIKVSQNYYSVPFIVPMSGSEVNPNQRTEELSAKILMEKYHYGKSFVGDALAQKIIYDNVEIPFFISDLKKVFKTGLFSLNDGRVAEFINIEYNFSKDTAVCSFSVRDKYTDRLEEVVYEPE